jgi:hypothetical protein
VTHQRRAGARARGREGGRARGRAGGRTGDVGEEGVAEASAARRAADQAGDVRHREVRRDLVACGARALITLLSLS